MIYSYQEILKKYKSRSSLEKALKNKEIYRLEKGVYSDLETANPVVVYSKKYPNAIITMDSAFYYYHLTDVIPNKIHLATNRNSNTITDDNIVQTFMNKEILTEGKTQICINDNYVNIYDKERLLIELIRKKSQIPFDYYKEIIYNYRSIAEKLDMYKIEKYLSLFKNEYGLSKILQLEVF